MSKKIKWGILGCGRIARKFADDLSLSKQGIYMLVPPEIKKMLKTLPISMVQKKYLQTMNHWPIVKKLMPYILLLHTHIILNIQLFVLMQKKLYCAKSHSV